MVIACSPAYFATASDIGPQGSAKIGGGPQKRKQALQQRRGGRRLPSSVFLENTCSLRSLVSSLVSSRLFLSRLSSRLVSRRVTSLPVSSLPVSSLPVSSLPVSSLPLSLSLSPYLQLGSFEDTRLRLSERSSPRPPSQGLCCLMSTSLSVFEPGTCGRPIYKDTMGTMIAAVILPEILL